MTRSVVGRQPSGSCACLRTTVSRARLAAATTAPPPIRAVPLHDPAREHRTIRFQTLPNSFKAQLVESAEQGQLEAGKVW